MIKLVIMVIFFTLPSGEVVNEIKHYESIEACEAARHELVDGFEDYEVGPRLETTLCIEAEK